MSKVLFDFLTESVFFDHKQIDEGFAGLSEAEIKRSLDQYRAYCEDNRAEALSETSSGGRGLKIYANFGHSGPPGPRLLTQAALYFDYFIISDPLYIVAKRDPMRSQSDTPDRTLAVDRQELANACEYIKRLMPLVAGGYVKLAPLGCYHQSLREWPAEILRLYLGEIPDLVKKMLEQYVRTYQLWHQDGNWIARPDRPLAPAQGVSVQFDGLIGPSYDHRLYDECTESGKKTIVQKPPSKKRFQRIAVSAVDHAMNELYTESVVEAARAEQAGAFFLTQSPLVSAVLQQGASEHAGVVPNVANSLLELELPVAQDVSFERIMGVRLNEGESFEAFRTELERRLRDLRFIKDEDELRISLQNVAHEMAEAQVAEVKRAFSKVRRTAFAQSVALIASLAATIQGSGFGVLTAAAALAGGYRTYVEYREKVKESAGYFLWRLAK